MLEILDEKGTSSAAVGGLGNKGQTTHLLVERKDLFSLLLDKHLQLSIHPRLGRILELDLDVETTREGRPLLVDPDRVPEDDRVRRSEEPIDVLREELEGNLVLLEELEQRERETVGSQLLCARERERQRGLQGLPHLTQIGIRVDLRSILLILQSLLLDVAPQQTQEARPSLLLDADHALELRHASVPGGVVVEVDEDPARDVRTAGSHDSETVLFGETDGLDPL